jgi:hypothetical protein
MPSLQGLFFLLVCLLPSAAWCQSAHGKLQGNRPVGVWEYYDGKDLGLRYDHDSSRVQYSKPDTARYLALLDSGWQPASLSRVPRVLGSNSDLLIALQRKLRYPIQDLRSGTTGTVVLTYDIDEQGQKTNATATIAPTTTLAEEVYRAVESTSFTYLPAIYQGKRVPAKIAFVVRFCLCNTSEDCQKAIREQAKAVPKPLGSLGEIIVTAH